MKSGPADAPAWESEIPSHGHYETEFRNED